MTAQIKYFLYARKSTDEEDKQIRSIQDQIIELKEFAQKENLEIADIFIEAKTAKIPGREIFNQLLQKMEEGKASGILAWHPDRLARNSVDGGKIIYLLDTEIIKSLKFPTFWFEPTPQGKFMLSIAFGQSKYYVDNLSENVKRGMRNKAKRGEFPGIAPPGYLNDRLNRKIVKDSKTAKHIKKAFELYSSDKYSYEDISQFLAKRGVLNRKNKPLVANAVFYLLSNPFYYGWFRYRGELLKGIHQSLISKSLFDKVQRIFEKRSRATRKRKRNFPFTGLLKCGECGFSITAEGHTKYYKRADRTANYVYYRCTKKGNYCSQPYITESDLTKQINKLIKEVSLCPKWAEKMLEKLEQDRKEIAKSSGKITNELKTEIEKINQKLEKLLDAHLDGIISKQVYKEKKEKLLDQKLSLEEKIIEIENKQFFWLEPFKNWILASKNASKIAESQDLVKKVSFVKMLGSNLILKNQKVRYFRQKPWAFLTERPTTRNWVTPSGFEPEFLG